VPVMSLTPLDIYENAFSKQQMSKVFLNKMECL